MRKGPGTGHIGAGSEGMHTTDPGIFRSTENDPAYNLAAEECILDYGVCPSLVLYENRDAVVIGKNQNPWIECSADVVSGSGVPLFRRVSGGGTVIHGPGNLNIGFVVPRDGFDRKNQLGLIARALSVVGVAVEVTDRGDLYVRGHKVSGNAMCYRKKHVLHHATLLVHADLERLLPAITAADLPIRTHAVASKRARVANLSDFVQHLQTETVSDRIVSEFMNVYPDAVLRPFPGRDETCVREGVERHASWEWVFGRTPRFEYCVGQSHGIEVSSGLIRSVPDGLRASRSASDLVGRRFDPGPLEALYYDSNGTN